MKRQPITQPLNFPSGDLEKIFRLVRPPEALAVQTLHQDPESGTIPLQHFNQGLPFIAEGKQAAGIGIQVKAQFNDRRQTMVTLPQIGGTATQINGGITRKVKHSPGLRTSDDASFPWNRKDTVQYGCHAH